MTSFDLLDDEELKILKMLIDPMKWDDVLTEFGSEMAVERELGLMPHEMQEWKDYWLEP